MHKGNSVVFNDCCVGSLLQVSQDLPFLHPSESSVLNRICRLGTDYIRFKEFIEQHTEHVHQQVSKSFVSPSASALSKHCLCLVRQYYGGRQGSNKMLLPHA